MGQRAADAPDAGPEISHMILREALCQSAGKDALMLLMMSWPGSPIEDEAKDQRCS